MKKLTIKGWVPKEETEAATLKRGRICGTEKSFDTSDVVYETKRDCLVDHPTAKKTTVVITVEHQE